MKENPKDFDILWVCDCGIRSLYHRDIEEHKHEAKHNRVSEFDLDTGKMLTRYKQEVH